MTSSLFETGLVSLYADRIVPTPFDQSHSDPLRCTPMHSDTLRSTPIHPDPPRSTPIHSDPLPYCNTAYNRRLCDQISRSSPNRQTYRTRSEKKPKPFSPPCWVYQCDHFLMHNGPESPSFSHCTPIVLPLYSHSTTKNYHIPTIVSHFPTPVFRSLDFSLSIYNTRAEEEVRREGGESTFFN